MLQAQACNFIKKETRAQLFSCEFWEISENTLFTEHLWTTASIYSGSLFNALRWNTNVKKISFEQNKLYKKRPLFSFASSNLVTVLLSIGYSCINWGIRFVYLKVCGRFSIFNSVSTLLNFCSTKSTDSLNLKRHDLFQN